METYIHFLTISLGWSLLCCDATVTVSLSTNANGDESLECGSYSIISCLINPYANLMSWEINGTTYAMCTPACSENPTFSRNYTPTYDTTNGVFNLTIERATFNDDSTTFKCDDGSSSDSITIEVLPAYSENTTKTKLTDGGKRVEFTTTCIQPGVEFEWFTVKTDNSDRKTYNKGQNETTETAECSLPSNCSEVGTGKVSSVIMIETVQESPERNRKEDRYIGVVVKYKNPDKNRTFRFDEIFHFEDPNSSTPNSNVSVSVPQSNTSISTPSSPDNTTLVILEKRPQEGVHIVFLVIGIVLIIPIVTIVIFIIHRCRKRPAFSPRTELHIAN